MSDETAEKLARNLPTVLPADPTSGNYKLLEPIASEFELLDDGEEDAQLALTVAGKIAPDLIVPSGETVTIEEGTEKTHHDVVVNGELIIDGRLKALTLDDSNGTVTVSNNGNLRVDDRVGMVRLRELGRLVGVLPRSNESTYQYRARLLAEYAKLTSSGTITDLLTAAASIIGLENTEPIGYREDSAFVELQFPKPQLDDAVLDANTVVELIDDRILTAGYRLEGTLRGTFTYITPQDYETANWDPELGYDGLDTDGNPKDNGGTYAGLIE